MSFYAEIDGSNVVLQVIEADAADIAGRAGTWVQTSMDGSVTKNYAGKGMTWDAGNNGFYAPKPYPSWTLDTSTMQWTPPVARPTDGDYDWHEDSQTWVKE